jgi:hypothetical protein
MAVVCRSYTTEHDVLGAVEMLMAAGVGGDRIRVLMGEPEHDARTERHGSYADMPGESDIGDEPVGDFAGREHPQSAGMGTYAGSADQQREGSYADADRDIVSTWPQGVERQRVAGHHTVHRLLLDAGLAEHEADRDVEALHMGRILLVADLGERTGAQAAAAFGE